MSDDDLDLEEWLAMTEEQQDVALDRAIAEYARWYDALPEKIKIKYHIARTLRLCVDQRRLAKRFDFFVPRLKSSQQRLLRWRAWRQTGQMPGNS